MRFALLLKRQRDKLCIMQCIMARRLNVSLTTLNTWENGKAMPFLHMLPPLCEHYKIDPKEMNETLRLRHGDIKGPTTGYRSYTISATCGTPYRPIGTL